MFLQSKKNQNRSQPIVIITILIRHVKMHALFSLNKRSCRFQFTAWPDVNCSCRSSLQPLYYGITFKSEQAGGDPLYRVIQGCVRNRLYYNTPCGGISIVWDNLSVFRDKKCSAKPRESLKYYFPEISRRILVTNLPSSIPKSVSPL